MEHILKLGSANCNIRLAGGKAAVLDAVLHAGFMVPDGFVITPEGFKTDKMKNAILSAFDRLGSEKVAVRSSAVAEDGHDASWAGQLETVLNVERADLLDCVKHCRDSASSARAQSYAKLHGIHQGDVAVLVQRMVQSEVSGVAFSVHPITQSSTQIVIEACLGLGEALVSGAVTPDLYVVSKNDYTILERTISSQSRKLGSQNEWLDLSVSGELQKLDDDHIQALARVVQELEDFLDYPVDVEWALAHDTIYVMQSRPITTLGVKEAHG